MNLWGLITLVAIALIVGGFFGGIAYQKHEFARDKEALMRYRTKYLVKSGWMEGYGTYLFCSLDYGRHWVAAEYTDTDTSNWGIRILGQPEDVWPELLGKVEGFEMLSDYVEKYGPLTLSGKNVRVEKALLEQAGFTVTGIETSKP